MKKFYLNRIVQLTIILVTQSLCFDFLNAKIGARELGMGGCGVASAQSATAIFYNPALIAKNPHISLDINHTQWFLDITEQSAFFLRPTSFLNFAFGLVNVNYGRIELRDKRPQDEPTEYYNPQDFILFLSLAKKYQKNLAIGGNLKFFYERIYTFNAKSFGADFGISFQPMTHFNIGASLLNFATPSSFIFEDFHPPASINLGLSYEFTLNEFELIPVIDLSRSLQKKREFNLNFGAELNLLKILSLRSGFDLSRQRFSAGFGLAKKFIKFCYAFELFPKNLPSVHRFSLKLGPNS